MSFDKCLPLYNYHHNQDAEQFHHFLKIPLYPFVVNPSPPAAQATTNQSSVPVVFSIPEYHIIGSKHYGAF